MSYFDSNFQPFSNLRVVSHACILITSKHTSAFVFLWFPKKIDWNRFCTLSQGRQRWRAKGRARMSFRPPSGAYVFHNPFEFIEWHLRSCSCGVLFPFFPFEVAPQMFPNCKTILKSSENESSYVQQMTRNCPSNGPKVVPKLSQSGPTIVPTWSQHCLRNDKQLTSNDSNIVPNLSSNCPTACFNKCLRIAQTLL